MSNENRLISAAAAKRIMDDCVLWETDEVEIAKTCIDLTPTVDAAEVVHGRWVNPYINRYGHPCHCCSICGFKASHQDKNYCPNCGAKMDGDGNG